MNTKDFQFTVIMGVMVAGLSLFLTGCTTRIPITNLENSYGTGFQNLRIPDNEEVKRRGSSRDLRGFTAQEIWNASLAVAMQAGPIVRTEEAQTESAKSGFAPPPAGLNVNGPADGTQTTIVAPPYILLLENRNQHTVLYCAYMDELYYDSMDPHRELFRVTPEEKKQFVEEVLNRVATQASVRKNLSRGGKWNYLPE